LNENRGELMQLTNEYIEALLEKDAPDPAAVAEWSQRVLPLFHEFTNVLDGIAEDMGPFLTNEQQGLLDAAMGGMHAGEDFTARRLEGWSNGEFDAATDWYRSPQFKEAEATRIQQLEDARRKAEREARGESPDAAGKNSPGIAGAAQAGATSRPATPDKDDWAKFVEDFIRRYQLNDEQKATAHKALKVAQDRREKYLRRKGDALADARRQVASAKTPADRAEATDNLKKQSEPLDNMFKKLTEQLDQLPTRNQRLAAARADTEAKSPPKPARPAGGSTPPGIVKDSAR
jgi:hypothetical protein